MHMNAKHSLHRAKHPSFNQQAASQLREIAELLKSQQANPFRVQAYLKAATTIESLTENIQDIVQKNGIQGLIDLPSIGPGIARSLYEFVATERMTRLQNLKGESDPVSLLQTIPGVGLVMANRIYEHLHVDSLESLELAAHDGRLKQVPGLGHKRQQAIQSWLYKTLGERKLSRRHPAAIERQPSVELLLKVDREYRTKAEANKLPTIAPRRFNPAGSAWLPVLHATYEHWHFTALYSNTARAHDLNRTRDWVVIYFYDDQHQEGQYTVVTETHGFLMGQRVVRGREAECHEIYEPASEI